MAERRSPVSQDTIVTYVRSRIVHGDYGPGEKLPVRNEYERRFGASSATVQRAFDRLNREGFVEVRGKEGTYVVERPPHLYRYALYLPHTPHNIQHNLYYAALSLVASSLEAELAVKFPIYSGVNEASASASYHALIAHAASHQLAGVIFVGYQALPGPSAGLLAMKHLARVLLRPGPGVPGFPTVDLGGGGSFFLRALDLLKARGRRRIALMAVAADEPERMDAYLQGASKRGLDARPYWVQIIHADHAEWAANMAHLMFRKEQTDRPDGLIIADDHLVPHVCAGLIQAGVHLPDDLEIVAHCNYPNLIPGVLPMVRLGYDIRQVLHTCIGLIDRQKRKEAVPATTVVEPLFEWELEGAVPMARFTPLNTPAERSQASRQRIR